MKIKIVNNSTNELPKYATKGSAGLDLRANIVDIQDKFLFNASRNEDGSITIQPGGRALIPTGLHIQLPIGYEATVQARSGQALKYGICMANGIGEIDSDYTGDVGCILLNLGFEPFVVQQGERIAQLVIRKVEQVELEPAEELQQTDRGEGGFNSTGVK